MLVGALIARIRANRDEPMRCLTISFMIVILFCFLTVSGGQLNIATAAQRQGTGADWLELHDDMQLFILIGLDKDLRTAGMTCPPGKTTYGQMYAIITSLAKRHKDLPMKVILIGYYKQEGCTIPGY